MNILINKIKAVLKEDEKYCIKETDIYISGNKIVSLGTAPGGFLADKIIDGEGRLALPGFINAHTHAYMSLFRNCADDLSFDDWLFGTILPMEDKLTGEDAYWGTLLSCIEMIKTGTTSFIDMHLFPHYVAQAVNDIGMRAVLTRGLVGDDDDEDGRRRIEEALADVEEWKDNERLGFMLAPHAPYTCNDGYLRICAEEAKKYGLGIHTHLSESENEMKGIAERYGCSPIELMEKTGIFDNKTVAAHCVNLSENDIRLLKKYNVTVATNPVSNMKLGNGFAPVEKLIAAGVTVALGTDSSASNNNLNMIQEMNTLALIHKGKLKNAQMVTSGFCLKAATENGAKAMRKDNIGEIKEGFLADISIMNLNYPWLCPKSDLIAALVYSASGTEFETVIIDGRIVMENGKISFVDEYKVYEECERIIKRIR